MKRFFNYLAASSLILVGVLTLCGGQPLGCLFGLMMFTVCLGSYGVFPKFWDTFFTTNTQIVAFFNNYFKYN